MIGTSRCFSALITMVLVVTIVGCAAHVPEGTEGHPSSRGVGDERVMAEYASDGSGQSPAEPLPEEYEAPAGAPRPGQDKPDPPDPGVQSDRTRTSMEGALVGALIGGLAGGFGFGGAEAALIGAAIGAGAGFLVADQIAKRKEQYASEEDFLESEIKVAADFNRTAAAYNHQLRGEIAALDRHTEELLLQYRQGLTAVDAIEQERAAVQSKIEEAEIVREDLLKEYKIKVAIYDEQKKKRAQSDEYLGSLAKELNQLDQNIQSLKSGSLELAQIEDKLTV